MVSRQSETEAPRVIHEIDGIQEYDNRLPNWWLATFFGAIAFASVYWFYYYVSGFGPSQMADYQAEMDQAAAVEAARIKASGALTPEALAALARDKGTVEQGRQAFAQTCVTCHRQDGGGLVGPNLTDDFWLHGSRPEQIYASITNGYAAKGMPGWGPQLGADRVLALTAFVQTLRGTNVPGGKAAQGDPEGVGQLGK